MHCSNWKYECNLALSRSTFLQLTVYCVTRPLHPCPLDQRGTRISIKFRIIFSISFIFVWLFIVYITFAFSGKIWALVSIWFSLILLNFNYNLTIWDIRLIFTVGDCRCKFIVDFHAFIYKFLNLPLSFCFFRRIWYPWSTVSCNPVTWW